MSRSCDVLVLGSEPDALVAATALAAAGRKVLLIDANAELGGSLRELEFAPGWRAAPLAADLGTLDARAFRGVPLPAPVESDPTVIALGEDGPLRLHRSAAQTAESLKRFSARDAARWPEFTTQLTALSGFLATLYRHPAPRIDAGRAREFLALLELGLRYRSLGRSGMIEMLRALPIPVADWLDDTFESQRLKGALAALAVADLCQGPMAGATALAFLHRHVGAAPGVIGERLRFAAGPGALLEPLAQRARAAGVGIETGAAVRELNVRDGRIAAAELTTGETIACRGVVSALDPYHSLIELVDPAHLDPLFTQAVRNIRFRGVTTKVLLGLDGLPDSVSGLAGTPACGGTFLIAPSLRYVERAFDAAKYGRCSEEPVVALQFPSVVQSGLAPAGQQVAVLHVQYTPYRLREGRWSERGDAVADAALKLVEAHLPGLTARVRTRTVLTPPELESQFGLREGAVSRGEFALDQLLFMRPVPGMTGHTGPIAGLALCGAGTHPGPGILGASGRMAAGALTGQLR